MKVFVSSVITGLEDCRQAVKKAIQSLGHEPLMAEDFPALAASPRVACLTLLREAEVVVLVCGERYGEPQQSGLSATHEEYREAQGHKPVLAFVKDGATYEPAQRKFLDEVEGWEGGNYRSGFASAEDLGARVTRALHEYQLAHAAGPVHPGQLLERALALVSRGDSGRRSSDPMLRMAVVSGPSQPILRPSEIEDPQLCDAMLQHALFGTNRIFDSKHGTDAGFRKGALVLSQEANGRHAGYVSLGAKADMVLALPFGEQSRGMGLPVVLEEDVRSLLLRELGYANWVFDQVDPTQRLTHLALAVQLDAQSLAWRTRAEHAASPSHVTSMMRFDDQHQRPVHLDPAHRTRAALRMLSTQLAEDFVALLRRQWQGNS